jgi:putative FmdB family regulatory protein
MPLYEYECTSCHRRTEKIQKYSDADLTVCPHCGGPLERTITAAAISFKGGGWYKDGYASPTPAASSDTSASNAGSTASASGDSAASGDSSSSGDSAKIVTTPSASPAPAPAVATKT